VGGCHRRRHAAARMISRSFLAACEIFVTARKRTVADAAQSFPDRKNFVDGGADRRTRRSNGWVRQVNARGLRTRIMDRPAFSFQRGHGDWADFFDPGLELARDSGHETSAPVLGDPAPGG
jgi:hypothetical protein